MGGSGRMPRKFRGIFIAAVRSGVDKVSFDDECINVCAMGLIFMRYERY